MRYTWICPHCGTKNSGLIGKVYRNGWVDKQVELCSLEEGGCDRYVVVKPTLTITAVTFKLVEAQYNPQAHEGREVEEPSPLDNY